MVRHVTGGRCHGIFIRRSHSCARGGLSSRHSDLKFFVERVMIAVRFVAFWFIVRSGSRLLGQSSSAAPHNFASSHPLASTGLALKKARGTLINAHNSRQIELLRLNSFCGEE
jgi:hypothetical protein